MIASGRVGAVLLAALLAGMSASGDAAGTNRCLGADGKMTYSDLPCPSGQQAAGKLSSNGTRVPTKEDAAVLSKATEISTAKPASAAEKRLQLDMSGPSLVTTACSVLVVQCVQPPDKTLDRCFTFAPRCASATPWLDGGSLACCPQACVDQYLGLRKAGKAPLQAFDVALHGAEGGREGCVVAR